MKNQLFQKKRGKKKNEDYFNQIQIFLKLKLKQLYNIDYKENKQLIREK